MAVGPVEQHEPVEQERFAEPLAAARYRTTHGPAHRAVWGERFPEELFTLGESEISDCCQRIMNESLAIVARHKADGTLYDARSKVSQEVLDSLGATGYWGLLVDRDHGGSSCPFAAFAGFLTRMATIDPTVAGLAGVHGCIGAVNAVQHFGHPRQRERLLPPLASGARLAAFALTEPGAGSDLTALRTTARLEGDHYLVDGEKLFISNALPGRTVGLVCLVEGQPAMLVAELPDREDDTFRLHTYPLHALKHSFNHGLVFRRFRVPRENLLEPTKGDGLTIAYHGLNRGRVALGATAAGSMRIMLASMLPWARFRRTYGSAIEHRELVQRRIGRLAALITGCDALVAWCGGLLDRGYRGEMECIVAKIFASEAQKEAAIELLMKTHGGRSFLHGHIFGDHVHEYLAPCIYEGEGEMLAMAFFRALVKEHGKAYHEPIGQAVREAGLRRANPANPLHAWALRKTLLPYARWRTTRALAGRRRPEWPDLSGRLGQHVDFAVARLEKAAVEISRLMARYQLELVERQCRMVEVSQRVQDLLTIVAVATWAARRPETILHDAADVLCSDLTRRSTGRRPSDGDLRRITRLGAAVFEGGFPGLDGITPPSILMGYGPSG